MTQSKDGGADRTPAGLPADVHEDPEVAFLVRQIASGWTMPPRGIGAPTWRDRVVDRRSRHPTRILAAAATAIAAVIVVAVGAAVLTGRPGPEGGPYVVPASAAAASGAPDPSAAPATPSSRPETSVPATPLPAYVAPGGVPAGLSVAAIVGGSWRVVDMTTGAVSDAIAPVDGSGSRLFALADGTYLCACATLEGRDGRSLRVVIRRYDALGRSGDELAALGYDAGAGLPQDAGGLPVSIAPSISEDGRIVAIGWTAWDGAFWRSGVETVEVAAGHVAGGYELPPLPGTLDTSVELSARWAAYAESGRPLSVWAPTAWISPDGRTIVTRRMLTVEGVVVRQDWFAGTFPPVHAGAEPALFGGTGDPTHAPCATGDAGDAGWTAAGVFSIVCGGQASAAVLRYDVTGRDIGEVDLAPETGGGSWPALESTAVADVPSGTLYLWDPFARRLVAVDTVGGRIARSTAIDLGTAGGAGPLETLAGLARSVLSFVVPTATAKTILQPAIALAPDGRTLYLLGTEATSFESAGAGSLGVVVVGADDLVVHDRWTPTADLTSVVVSADGRYVLAAGAPGVDAAGSEAPWEASITCWDAATGTVRAVAGRLGTSWIDLVSPQGAR